MKGETSLDYKKMIEKLNNNSIKNEELWDCLNSKNFNIVGLTIYKIIERKYCDDRILKALTQIAAMLDGYKVAGPYQIGHLAMAALYLIEDESALDRFTQLHNNLNDNDKFLVDSFIERYKE